MPDSLHPVRFPGESEEYRNARNELLKAELELRDRMEVLAGLRRKLPLGAGVKEDYVFDELTNDESGAETTTKVKLSELFEAGKNSLILYSFMYGPEAPQPCPACTSFIDGMDGYAPHITQRVNLAVVAKSPIRRTSEFAALRGWENVRLLSSEKNTYNTDYFGQNEKGQQLPAVNVFVKRDGGIHHFYSTEMLYVPQSGHPRHADLLWPIWSYFDLTPEGRGSDWFPKLSYA